jgi:hypothetical protein
VEEDMPSLKNKVIIFFILGATRLKTKCDNKKHNWLASHFKNKSKFG